MSTQIQDIRTKIADRIKASTPTQKLYNPSNEWVVAQVNGVIYPIPPDGYARPLGDEKGEQRLYDGILEIKDQYGPNKEEKALAVQQRRKTRANAVVVSSLEIVQHLITKLHKRGVVFLMEDGSDEQLIAQAKDTWAEFQVKQADQVIAAYNNRTAAFHRDPRNSGRYAPSMTEREIQAQEVLDAWQSGRLDKYKFICPERDGYGTNDQAKFDLHMRVSHPAVVHEEGEPAPTPKRRGRPPKAA
jgi:hypothetical protein